MTDDFTEVVRSVVARHGTLQNTLERAADPTSDESRLWGALNEIGVHALSIPEACSGLGAPLSALGAVLRELGRTLVAGDYLPTQTAARLLMACDTETAAIALTSIARGAKSAVYLAPDCGSTPLTYTRGRLSGRAIVPGGLAATFLVLEAVSDGRPVVVRVEAPELRAADPLDITRDVGILEVDGAACDLLASGDPAQRALRIARIERRLLNASEQCGSARAALDMAVEYAKTREQFGVPIGAFQAISHSCADMFRLVDSADALVAEAFSHSDAPELDIEALELASLAAAAWCGDTVVECAQRNVQIHGGIAITYEYPAHLLLRRAKASVAAAGHPSAQRDMLLQGEIAGLHAERTSNA